MTYLNLVDPYSSVKNLIEAGESEKLEFKSSLRFSLHKGTYDKELTHEVLKTIAGFLNTNGGTLLIGIGDGGEVIGIKKDGLNNNDKYLLHLTGLFNKHIGKEATTNIKTRIETYLGKRICIVECKESEIPVYLDNISNKKEVEIYFVRTGPSTVRLGTKQAVEHIRNKTTRNQP